MTDTIKGTTQLAGLLGWPVSHSLSPAMHNAAAADLGLDLLYLPLEVHPDQLPAAVRGLAVLGFCGANVTVPHKEAVLPLLDVVDPAAAAIGAVNTIIVTRQQPATSLQPSTFNPQPLVGRDQPSSPQTQAPRTQAPLLSGHNTDWSGFLADVERLGVVVDGRESLILGAGGSARAVAYGLATAGSQVHIYARRLEQAQQVVAGLASHCPPGSLVAHPWPALGDAPSAFPQAALMVNTTPLGMAPKIDVSPWPESAAMPQDAFVYDLVYNPAETRLMRQAQAADHETSNGLGMLLYQGAQAFKLWTGHDPNLHVMAQALHLTL